MNSQRMGTALAMILSLAAAAGAAPAPSPEEIVRQMEKKMYPDAKTEMVLKHTSSAGTEEEFRMTSYAKDNNQRIIVRFVAPARMVGNDLLMLDRNVWLYDSPSGREVKIPSNQSFGGTGFSYGDILRLNFSDNYVPVIQSQTESAWTLELTAKLRDAPYYRVILVIDKEFFPQSGQCFTRTGETLKEMKFTNVQDPGTGSKPLTVTVTSPLDPHDVSSLTIVKETRKSFPDNIFNKRNLSARLEEKL